MKLLGMHEIHPPHGTDARPWALDPLTGEVVYVTRRPQTQLNIERWRELERRATRARWREIERRLDEREKLHRLP